MAPHKIVDADLTYHLLSQILPTHFDIEVAHIATRNGQTLTRKLSVELASTQLDIKIKGECFDDILEKLLPKLSEDDLQVPLLEARRLLLDHNGQAE